MGSAKTAVVAIMWEVCIRLGVLRVTQYEDICLPVRRRANLRISIMGVEKVVVKPLHYSTTQRDIRILPHP